MWRAEQFASEARRMEEQGRVGEARQLWARATAKAESVLVHHPTSRWADDALVLQGEGLARSGDCAAAAAPLASALATVTDEALGERATLAAVECALEAGELRRAAGLAAEVTGADDARRRARAAYLPGRTAEAQGDRPGAVEWFERSALVPAAAARLRLLVSLGRTDQALAGIAPLARRMSAEDEWTKLVAAVAEAEGVDAASTAAEEVLRQARLPTGQRARMLVADGDRLFAAGRIDRALARYRAAAGEAPDSADGGVARARLVRIHAAAASDLTQLEDLVAEARSLAVSAVGGRAVEEARALERLLGRVIGPHSSLAAELRAAELARDSLRAPALATRLFLAFAAHHPASVFAPKALVAGLALDPPQRDSIIRVLDSAYPTSPYTRVLYGEASPTYAAVEDSLATALGLAPGPAVAVARWAPPEPRPRGPQLADGPAAGRLPPVSPRRPAGGPEQPHMGRPR